VKRKRTGKWLAIFQVEDSPIPLPSTNKVVGIDVGIKYFLTDSDGHQAENPRYYHKTLQRIRLFQRSFSMKKKGSSNGRKTLLKLNRAYEKLTNQRNDFLHKLSRFYVRNYGIIVTEDLHIANMVKNHNLAKNILDASWWKFFKMLSYKAERAGRTLLKVKPAYTSQENKELIEDRDLRGSINVLNRGLLGVGTTLSAC